MCLNIRQLFGLASQMIDTHVILEEIYSCNSQISLQLATPETRKKLGQVKFRFISPVTSSGSRGGALVVRPPLFLDENDPPPLPLI